MLPLPKQHSVYLPWRKPATSTQVTVWSTCRLAVASVAAIVLALLSPAGDLPALAVAGVVMFSLVQLWLEPHPCVVCGEADTYMIPNYEGRFSWWRLTPGPEDLVWLCAVHLTVWMQLRKGPSFRKGAHRISSNGFRSSGRRT